MSAAVASLLLALTGTSVAAMSTASAAWAAPVYQITGEWASSTPTTVANGDVVTGVWRVNVNDDQPAPANDPVDNVTFSVTLAHGLFQRLPDTCLTSGVAPASSISSSGATLTCNLGTHNEGTAVVVQAPFVADGTTGDQITATGTIDGQDAVLSPIAIDNSFGMDIAWRSSTNTKTYNADTVDADLEWTLFLMEGSDPGPDSVSYDLTITAGSGATVNVGPQVCAAFTTGAATGHPWSGGSHPADQMAPFVDSCTLTKTGPTSFTLTLTGIDYSLAQVPTEDSTGFSLPPDRAAVASGSIWLRVTGTQNDSISLSSNAPTYTAPSGATTVDDPANNTASKTWTRGGWSSAWQPAASDVQVPSWWSNQFYVAPGAQVAAINVSGWGLADVPATETFTQCIILDTRYVTFTDYQFSYGYKAHQPNTTIPGSTVEYYVGTSPSVTPGSGSYDPNSFACAGAGGWTTAVPADLSTVKAVRVNYPHSVIAGAPNAVFNAFSTVNDDAPIGQDIWQFGELEQDGTWIRPNRSMDPSDAPNGSQLTAGYRYPFIASGRDVLYVIGATPAVKKSVDSAVIKPGIPATYTLTYSANGTGAIDPTVDDYDLVDILPAGMSYVSGSATPAPTVTTSGGQQTLTWTLDGVPTNAQQALSYQAVADESVTPGQALTNSVTATVGGVSTSPATAQVTVSSAGYTTIVKTADAQYIPNVDGNGDGSGSWTVTLRSYDPLPQDFTDTIDILPYNGDGRGTSYAGSYTLQEVVAVAGATVYYTTADPSTLSDDPADPSNGAPDDITGNTVGWSTTYAADATAVRVIGPALAPGAQQQFTVPITTDGAQGGDVLVNRAQARDGHTELVMRTSAPITVANFYSATLKKYVQDVSGVWHDANAAADYPRFHYGDTIPFRVVVTNTGQGPLTDIDVSDDKQPTLGAFHIDSLASGASQTHEYSIVLDTSVSGTVVNTACATAATPPDAQVAPAIPCDPAGFDVVPYTTDKTADPASGTTVSPGQVIHYTVTLTQQGPVAAAAEFSDDLSDVLDDASYNDDVVASVGDATITGTTLTWTGTIPVDGAATVTYSVTVHDTAGLAAEGNGELRNAVSSPGCVPVNGQYPDCTTDHEPGDPPELASTGIDVRLQLILTGFLLAGGALLALSQVRRRRWTC